VQGNYIGTTASGTAPRGNGKGGILYDAGGTTIGGTEAGAGNVISGNSGPGIHYRGDLANDTLSILGNKIGTTPSGQPLGNAGAGVLIKPSFDDPVGKTVIGSASAASGRNTIAFNGRHGVETDVNSGTIGAVEVRANSIFDNALKPFHLDAGTNFPRVPPTITGFWPLRGTTCNSCLVDIYSDAGTEGRIYEGTATANTAGTWSFPFSLRGPRITVTETDIVHRTSEYSAAVVLPPRPDGRIKVGSGALAGNDIYDTTGDSQSRTGSAVRGKTIKFTVSVQNDSKPDRFKIQGAGSATHYTVKYFRGSTNITSAVVAGTYTTRELKTDEAIPFIVKVKVKSSAPAGSSVTRLVTITSVADPAVKDVVKLTGKRK
jgi:hypothetical protein